MEQINRIELRGNIGFVRVQTYNGQKALRMTVATNYVYRGSNGEPVIETTWHYISAWEGKGMPDFEKIEKGGKVSVWGRLRSQRYTDSDGTERTAYEVLAKKIQLIEDDEMLQYEM
ncbi:MAG: single-stranded DNA-binding protein [Bacteroidales bacterium]|nr:single-stranded DNA-binding protein [Bacteroidales bacterium]MBP5538040.1 single-stranded DNA-binding protein [Bacteroidales bacterium]MBP5795334.1 single-stranded DNA-binding protein [Bacteroidales bacterium]MBQ9878787.1 single-stranded DNA-binding protein [Bacteroidales bacterium]MBR3285331.1 single-stranded DNA-binding protein [Bacteroidales bacterium]